MHGDIDESSGEADRRYCANCGEIFSGRAQSCPTCGVYWHQPEPRLSVYNFAALLTYLQWMHQDGSLDDASFAALREPFERRLMQIRPPQRAPEPVLVPRPRMAPPQPTIPPQPSIPPPQHSAPARPPAPPREPLLPKVAEWTAARQADILLYLGAFLLSIAALIFVGYQGNALSGPGRFAILVAYTLGFLVLGIRLPHWERVREAGMVFLALGALLVPIDFIALRTQVVGGNAPVSWLWLAGSVTTAALYLALGLRGFGRLYLYPGLLAAFVAWGSLAAVADLPIEWYGAWFAGAALLVAIAVPRLPESQRDRARLAAEALGCAALLAAQVTAGIGGRARAQLPIAYFLLGACFATSLLARRSSTRALAVLPVLAALTMLTTWWATFGLNLAWYGCFLAAAALGYVVNARFDREERREVWLETAAAFAACSLVAAHSAVYSPGAKRAALPLTYAEVLAGTTLVYIYWHLRSALAIIPPLAAGFAITAGWALDAMGREWIGAWVAGAALGYLAIAELDVAVRQLWRGAAAVAATIALWAALMAVGIRGVATAELPATCAILLAGAIWDAWRRRDAAQAIVPALAALLGITTSWTIGGDSTFPWIGCWIAGAALGYLALAELNPAARQLWRTAAAAAGTAALLAATIAAGAPDVATVELPATCSILLVGASWDSWRRRDAARAILPALAAYLGITTAWTIGGDDTFPWIGCWMAGAALGYLALAELDVAASQSWRAVAACVGAVALLVATIAAGVPDVATAELPLECAILLAGASWDAWRRRDEAQALVPALGALLGITTAWTIGGPDTFTWIGYWVAGAALGYLALAETDPQRCTFWRLWAAGAGIFALVAAHTAAAARPSLPWQLPAAYGIMLGGAIWDGYRRRDAGLAVVPVLGAIFVDAVLWACGVGAEWWGYAGLAAATLIVVTSRWWRRTPLRPAGWLYALGIALLLPTLFRAPYTAHPVHGFLAYLWAALLIVAVALRAGGALAPLIEFPLDRQARIAERQMLVLVSGVYTFIAAAYFNAWMGLQGTDQAWVFAGIGLTAWVALALAGRALPKLQISLIPIGSAGLALGALLSAEDAGQTTLLLVLGAIGPVLAVPATRRWSLWAIAAGFGLFALGTGWSWQELSAADLPLAYAFVAADLWLALLGLRTYRRDERGLVVTALSWVPAAVALVVALSLVNQRGETLSEGISITQTREWAVLAITLAVCAGMVTAEGIRLRLRIVWVPGSAGLLLASLFAIAIVEPTNVQAYTLTVGAYLVALAFTYRSTAQLFGRHMQQHEGVLLAGLLLLTLPAAQQGWGPNGSRYGLELIGMGFVFLALGLTLYGRWAVAGGVLTLSGVALRWLAVYSTAVPGWLVFGIAGTVLIAVGLLLLFQRERWERFRHRVARWWLEVPGDQGPRPPRGTGLPHQPAPPAR
jgi:hypothetical protein